MSVLPSVLPLLVEGVDKVPAPDDVKAGWVAFGIFIALGLAVVVLAFSMTRHLRKARDNADQGMFDPSEKGSRGRGHLPQSPDASAS
jgi:hypothetical protein